MHRPNHGLRCSQLLPTAISSRYKSLWKQSTVYQNSFPRHHAHNLCPFPLQALHLADTQRRVYVVIQTHLQRGKFVWHSEKAAAAASPTWHPRQRACEFKVEALEASGTLRWERVVEISDEQRQLVCSEHHASLQCCLRGRVSYLLEIQRREKCNMNDVTVLNHFGKYIHDYGFEARGDAWVLFCFFPIFPLAV